MCCVGNGLLRSARLSMAARSKSVTASAPTPPPLVQTEACKQPGYWPGADLTAPLAIHRFAAIRTKNTTFAGVQVEGIGPTEPENSASPCGLSGTNTVSMVTFAPPGSQRTVPLTRLTAPGVPIVLPPASTNPSTSKL